MDSEFKIALIGNPNTGKSTLFNDLTGLSQKTGNFPGVTVDKRSGYHHSVSGKILEITDLPGIYSLYPRAGDDKISYQVLCDRNHPDHPDKVIVVVDASNLKRNLLLFTQVADLQIPVVLALNMMDLVERNGVVLDIAQLSAALGVPVLPVNARGQEGLRELIEAIETLECPKKETVGPNLKFLAPEIIGAIEDRFQISNPYQALQMAHQHEYLNSLSPTDQGWIEDLEARLQFDSPRLQTQETILRYQFISALLLTASRQLREPTLISPSARIDKILTHKIWGLAIFVVILLLVFQSIFSFAQYPMDMIDHAFAQLTIFANHHLPPSPLTNLFTEGVLAGIRGVVIFLPQIVILFAFIALMEDTGYMARVSFMMDRVMRKVGLNGKSVVPLISGVACAVPAIMATRNIENPKDRLITILVTPLMSCSARLPVYSLIISLFVPRGYLFGFFDYRGLCLLAMYMIGFFSAIGASWIMKKIIRAKGKSFFIMELPIYRWPVVTDVFYTLVQKAKTFLFEAGKVIVAVSIILWVLASYGPGDRFRQIEQKFAPLIASAHASAKPLSSPNSARSRLSSGPFARRMAMVQAAQLERDEKSEKLENSYAGLLGHFIEPVIRPLGFDWKIGIALIASFAAREVFVGTMATIYSVEGTKDNQGSIREKMQKATDPVTGKPVFTVAVAFSLMLFYAFAMQCTSTLAIVHRETKSWRWPLIQFGYMTGLAYLASLLAYQLLK